MAKENVGTLTAGEKLKLLHSKEVVRQSLKSFARAALKSDDVELQGLARQWFKNKSRAGQTPRSAANAALAKTIGAAVKQSRRTLKK